MLEGAFSATDLDLISCLILISDARAQESATVLIVPLILPRGGGACPVCSDPGLDDSPILGGVMHHDQLVSEDKMLIGSIEPAAGGGSELIAQLRLYLTALGLATSQFFYAYGENHELCCGRYSGAGSRGRADLSECAPYPGPVFRQPQEHGPDSLLSDDNLVDHPLI